MRTIAIAATAALMFVGQAQAAWTLDGEASTVSFVSTKAINVAEVHRFAELSGSVDADGQVMVSIGLASVDTAIELRDQRMREMLFQTDQYTLATVSAKVDADALEGMEPGDSVRMMLEGIVSLHGESRPLPMSVVVARTGDSSLLVTSEKPVVVNAPEFKLAEGVEALREVAGLPSISLAVPVSFVLSFSRD
jgi:polyisoprenoid-binding protein YceI